MPVIRTGRTAGSERRPGGRRRRGIGIACILAGLTITLFSSALLASEDGNAGEAIIHHIADGQVLKPLPYVPGIRLPTFHIAGFSLPVTGHVVMMWVGSLILIATFVPACRKRQIAPRGVALALEPVVLFVRDDIVYPILGEAMGKKWFSFFVTVFFFILVCNLMGLIPVFTTATANLSVTAAMGLLVLVLIFGAGIRSLGFVGFFKNMVPSGVPWPMIPILFPIEFAGLFIKAFALCLRLFANMLAGHIVMYALLALIFVLHPLAAVLSVPMAVFIYLLEILVAFIQAFVFTLLACIFIGMACSHH